MVADIVLCAPVVEREAREQGIALEAHYAHLLVHGALHAQGFDHERAAEAERDGGARDARSLVALGFADPYAGWPPELPASAALRPRAGSITAAIASSTRTIAAPSCQCSVSFSHHAPETMPSTGIIITDMLEATGGRLRARISQIACAKPKISSAL